MKKRNWIKICLGIAGIALIVVLVFTLIPKTGPWLSAYTYRKQITISGTTAGAQTNYQMRLTIHKGSGSDSGSDVYLSSHCQDDFDDIRFTKSDRETELDYWRETYTSGDNATFWVEFDSIPASPGSANFYIYHGNSTASSDSNGDNTFLFFDNFPGSSLDGNKWTVVQGDVGVTGGTLALTGTTGTRGLIDGKTTIPQGAAIHAEVKSDTNDIIGVSHICSLRKPNDWNYRIDIFGTTLADEATFSTYDVGNGTQTSHIAISTCSAYHEYQVTWITGEAKSYQDTTLLATHTTNVPSTDLVAAFYEANVAGDNAWIDWVFVRKFVSPEPTWGTWGSEEKNTS